MTKNIFVGNFCIVLKRIKQFYFFAIHPKKAWKLPKHSDVIIYDVSGSEILYKYLNGKITSVLFVRNELINIPCLLISFFTRKFWKGQIKIAYANAFIKIANPGIIITFVDTDKNFYLLAKPNENTIKILVQNGTRSYYKDLFESLDLETNLNREYRVDYMGVFGKNISKYYSKHIYGKTLNIGSIKNNHFKVKTRTVCNSIGYISQYNIKDIEGRTLNGEYFTYSEYWRDVDQGILKFLKNYCKKYNKKLFIIPRFSEKNHLNEKNYFKSILGTYDDKNLSLEREYFESILKSDVEFSDKNSIESGYLAVDTAEVVVGTDDTLVYESAARGNKTAFFSIRSKSFSIDGLGYGWPGDYVDSGSFWTNVADNNEYEKILNYLFSISNEEWKDEIKRTGFYDIINYDPGNSILRSILN